VERDRLLTGAGVQAGDVLFGLASSGLHSNGFSLVRKVVEVSGLDYGAPAPFDDAKTLAEALLAPTRIYVKSCLAAVKTGGVKALSHITGGGLVENLPRVMPETAGADIDAARWSLPPVFSWLAEAGGIGASEMARTFNCGIGMVVVADAAKASEVKGALEAAGETVAEIGRITERADEAVVLNGAEAWRTN
jgi:phosphoribosylformylglycinamidine cyclo-ligase